ncbi:hypothetical protein H8356DRAFT_1343842 [Neocallimastix lanati (nom. inval.)]|nr:hypothetical protein H8356DRAFT_1343842 [Neocallimastix sp. JGI-2020a]
MDKYKNHNSYEMGNKINSYFILIVKHSRRDLNPQSSPIRLGYASHLQKLSIRSYASHFQIRIFLTSTKIGGDIEEEEEEEEEEREEEVEEEEREEEVEEEEREEEVEEEEREEEVEEEEEGTLEATKLQELLEVTGTLEATELQELLEVTGTLEATELLELLELLKKKK